MGNVENFKALTEQITRELKGRREKLDKDAYEASRRLFVKAQAIVERCQRGNLSKPDEDLIALANDVQLKLIRIGGATEDAKRAKDLIAKFGDVALSTRQEVTGPKVEKSLVLDDQDTDGLGEGSDDDAPEESEESPEDEAEAQADDGKGDNPTSGTSTYSEGGAGKVRNASGAVKPKPPARKKASKKAAKKK